MSLVRVNTEIYKPVFDENEDKFIDKCPYAKHERNRIHNQCRCRVGSNITSRVSFNQHIKSHTHKTFIKNYSEYYKEVDEAEEKIRKLLVDNELLKRKVDARERDINELKKEKYKQQQEFIKVNQNWNNVNKKLDIENQELDTNNKELEEENNILKNQLNQLITGINNLIKIN